MLFGTLEWLTSLVVFFYPETKGRVSGCSHFRLARWMDHSLRLQTLEEMDAAFGDNASEKEREHMERICRELGLPANALLSA